MNRMLSSIVGFLNGFLALAFLLIGVGVGNTLNDEMGGAGVFVGIIGGLVLAVLFCGVLAVFISMRDELINIRQLLEQKP